MSKQFWNIRSIFLVICFFCLAAFLFIFSYKFLTKKRLPIITSNFLNESTPSDADASTKNQNPALTLEKDKEIQSTLLIPQNVPSPQEAMEWRKAVCKSSELVENKKNGISTWVCDPCPSYTFRGEELNRDEKFIFFNDIRGKFIDSDSSSIEILAFMNGCELTPNEGGTILLAKETNPSTQLPSSWKILDYKPGLLPIKEDNELPCLKLTKNDLTELLICEGINRLSRGLSSFSIILLQTKDKKITNSTLFSYEDSGEQCDAENIYYFFEKKSWRLVDINKDQLLDLEIVIKTGNTEDIAGLKDCNLSEINLWKSKIPFYRLQYLFNGTKLTATEETQKILNWLMKKSKSSSIVHKRSKK